MTATFSNLGARVTLLAALGSDLAIPVTVTVNGAAFPWAGVTVTTQIVNINNASTPAPVATLTFTPGVSGAATVSLTKAQLDTLGDGSTYLYSIVANVGNVLQWSLGGQMSVKAAFRPNQSATAGIAVTVTAGTIAVTLTTAVSPSILAADAAFTGRYVPLIQTQGGTPLNPTTPVSMVRFTPANNYINDAAYGITFVAQTFGGHIGTNMFIGYNPNRETVGVPACFMAILADAEDTPGGAVEIQWSVNFPDGTQYQPIQTIAHRANDHIGSTSFQHGPGGGSLTFNNADGSGYASMAGASTGVPGVIQFFQPITVQAAAVMTINAPITATPGAAVTALTIPTGGAAQPAIALTGTSGYFRKELAAPLDFILLSTPPAASGGATTKHGGSLYFGTSFWNGSASVTEYAVLDARRGSTAVGHHYFQVSSGMFIQPQSNQLSAVVIRQPATPLLPVLDLQDSAGNPLSRFNKDGYFMTRKIAAPADGDLAASELALWFDSTNGAAKAMFKGKTVNGTVVSAAVAMA